MSTAHCNPPLHPERLFRMLLALSACALCQGALAVESDQHQPIEVSANHFTASRNGATVLSGAVVITQGTLEAHAEKGTAHRNAAGKVSRIVLEGKPARFQQKMDGGGVLHARGDTIDYQVGSDTITLNGNAHVQQPGQGSFNGAHLLYNSATGAMQGNGGNQGRVHLTLEPREPTAASSAGKP